MPDDDPIKTPLGAHTTPGQDLGDDEPAQLSLTDGHGDVILSSAATVNGCLPLGDGNLKPAQTGPGRREGSLNKSSAELRKYLLAKGYMHPAEALAQLISTPVGDLADELSRRNSAGDIISGSAVEPLDALKVQVSAAKELLPYFASKLPVQVEIKKEVRSLLLIGELNADDDDDLDEFAIQSLLEENQ